MNIRLSAQNSQKVDEQIELNHGNKHIITVETTGDLKKAFEYTAMREIETQEVRLENIIPKIKISLSNFLI